MNIKWMGYHIMLYRNGEFYWKPCYMYCNHERYNTLKWTLDAAYLWFELSIAKRGI